MNVRATFVCFLLVVSLLVCTLPPVLAIGVSPPRADILFVPDQRSDFSVTLINDGDRAVDVDSRVDGLLNGRIAVKQPIRIPAHGTTSVPISVQAPDSLDTPGYHTTFVFFTEHAPEDGGTFTVRTEVGLRVVLWEPYPGQYAEIVPSALSVAKGNDTKLKLLVNNLGTDAIADGTATVRVVSAGGDLRDVFTFSGIAVPGNSNHEYFRTIPSSGYPPGKYILQASLDYGSNRTTMNSTFAIGTQDIDIVALEGPLYLDKPLNRYTVHVESLWNLPLENVYATVELGSTPSQTPPITLGPFEAGSMTNYWETDKSVPVGQALAHVTVHYPGGSRDQFLPITVFNETPVPPRYESPSPSNSTIELSVADIGFAALAIIVVVLLVLFALGRLRNGRNGGGRDRSGGSGAGDGVSSGASGSSAPATVQSSPVAPPIPPNNR